MIKAAQIVPLENSKVKLTKNFKNIAGQKFSRLFVIEFYGFVDVRRNTCWICWCDCGKIKIIRGSKIIAGEITSCGCLGREKLSLIRVNRITHGHARRGKWTPEFRAWHAMKTRCSSPSTPGYKNYGGRGITVCERWIGRFSFPDFLNDVGLKPSKTHSLDRVDTNGNYSCGKCDQCLKNKWPKNVKWSTKLEQDNNRRTNVFLTHNGIRLTKSQWARKLNMKTATFESRLLDWGIKRAIETPIKNQARYFTYDGKTKRICDWSKITGLSNSLIYWRIKQGKLGADVMAPVA